MAVFSAGRFPIYLFSISNFYNGGMVLHVTCFAKVSLLLLESCIIKVITFFIIQNSTHQMISHFLLGFNKKTDHNKEQKALY